MEPQSTSWDIWRYQHNAKEPVEQSSDTSTVPAELEEEGPPYSETFTFAQHFERNQRLYNIMRKDPQPIPGMTAERFYLKSPTASKVLSKCLHPGLYMNGNDVESLQELSRILQAPDDWQDRIGVALTGQKIGRHLRNFLNETNVSDEMDNEMNLCTFVKDLADELDRNVGSSGVVTFGVGGIFPDPNCAVIGWSDRRYVEDGSLKFTTEVKLKKTYQLSEPWYHRSRLCQSTSAMYYSRSPLLLCSPVAYKLLIERDDRNSILYFPAGLYSGETAGEEFPYVIGLLILSRRDFNREYADKVPKTPKKAKPPESVPTTVEAYSLPGPSTRSKTGAGTKRKYEDSPVHPKSTEESWKVTGKRSMRSKGKDRWIEEPTVEEESHVQVVFFLTQEQIEEALATEVPQAALESSLVEDWIAEQEELRSHKKDD